MGGPRLSPLALHATAEVVKLPAPTTSKPKKRSPLPLTDPSGGTYSLFIEQTCCGCWRGLSSPGCIFDTVRHAAHSIRTLG